MVLTKQADAALEQAVSDALDEDRELDGNEITVRVTGGQVLLQGTVDTLAELNRAGRIAAGVKEVKLVANQLSVDAGELKDENIILARIKDELRCRPSLENLKIEVQVHQGRITLDGPVESLQQKLEAHEVVCGIRGARSIVNLLEVAGAENESGVE